VATDTTTANFRPFIESRALAAKAIQEFGLDKPPYRISPTRFFGSVVTIDEVRNSTIMIIRARLDDPTESVQAAAIGCHITVTHDIVKRLSLVGRALEKYSLDTLKMFNEDATQAGFTL
jgi:transaldolase